jgi:putative membrane-bound dehydrogenase-like protein
MNSIWKTSLSAVALCLAAASLHAQGFSPEEAVRRMQLPDDLQVQLVAAEPLVRQPVTMTFDDRGRMWIIQYLQYPNPAGLKPVKVDQYLRTVYDRVPEPPPKGPKGTDRITILYDPDENGRFRKSKDFVTGLNLASGLALGHGGVFVVQPPYLLFYPDRDGDDVPDGDPEVLLSGFGMEDAHAFANSLQWGPDGWLYGAQGSTVTAHIRGVEFQQGIWRYHPITREFELFAEGGGNTWGLDFDCHGNAIAGTNWGGKAMLHQVQGGYYVKGFAKHGPLHNPHTYGYFEHIPYQDFKGGHVTCGGIVYQGGLLPAKYRDRYLAGNLLSNALYWHVLERDGSTFKARHGGDLLVAHDTWFRPIDLLTGPDGAVYVADWYDKRANHVDPVDNWDRSNGRVYKIVPASGGRQPPVGEGYKIVPASGGRQPLSGGRQPLSGGRQPLSGGRQPLSGGRQPLSGGRQPLSGGRQPLSGGRQPLSGGRKPPEGASADLRPPLGKRPSEELVKLLAHPNDWWRREARRILAERRDAAVIPLLRKNVREERDQLALESLWALYVSGGFDDKLALELLKHPNEDVRAWTVRLLGDAKKVSAAVQTRLVSVAQEDASPTVRCQLACTCKRLPGKDALPIVRELLHRSEDVNDQFIPLLLWWAIEDKAVSHRAEVLGLLEAPETWRLPLVRQYLIERIGRRYLAEGSEAGYAACARLLALAPGAEEVNRLIGGMEKALEGRRLERVPAPLEKHLAELWARQPNNVGLVRFAVRLGSEPAYQRALRLAGDPKAAERDRLGLIEMLGQVGKADCVPVLLRLLEPAEKDAVRKAALAALQSFPDPKVSERVLALYPKMPAGLRSGAQALILSRPASALAFLKAVDAGTVAAKEVPLEQLRRVVLYKDAEIQRLVEKHWGKIGAQTTGEKTARIRAVGLVLSRGKGDPVKGQALFKQHCATCHTLFGEGNKVGPDLTTADRKSRDFLLTSIIDPSAVIRPEFTAFNVATKDGRALTGLIAEASPQAVTLVDAKNERTVLARDRIEVLEASPVSLMPEKILDPLDDQQLCDLFSYLMADRPPK